MTHRIREAMKTRTFDKLQGEIEVDETFVGGKAANMHKHLREKRITGRGTVNKTIVQGVLQRGGEVRAQVVRDTEGETLRPTVYRHVAWGQKVYTDAHQSYVGLVRAFVHSMVDHAIEFVRGSVHTNGIENFWSLLKRSLNGTWTHVAAFHLERYCTEQAWRFNNRKTNDGIRFTRALAGVLGRRITTGNCARSMTADSWETVMNNRHVDDGAGRDGWLLHVRGQWPRLVPTERSVPQSDDVR